MVLKPSMMADIPFPISDLVLCPENCSGHGECLSGICLCQVQYSGWACNEHNRGYFVSFGVFFYIVCLVAIVQLVLCVHADLIKQRKRNVRLAFKLDLQKFICLSVICASGSRATYFIFGIMDVVPSIWKQHLFSTFYPFVLSGFSLIICMWAESFHLSDIENERPRFLTKSLSAFIVFNVFIYLIIISQAILGHTLPHKQTVRLNEVANGAFAFLMFVALIFFLIYGVEIFCKIEGAFKPSECSRKRLLFNFHQIFQSRLGLVAQAALQLAVTMFLMIEVLGKLWKRQRPIGERNILDIAFHVAELGCALWFPCCLWNITKPNELWILNPRKLLMLQKDKEETRSLLTPDEITSASNYNTFKDDDDVNDVDDDEVSRNDCWICYDPDNDDEMIQPCDCKGGMKQVHHECLKKWLLERPQTSDGTISCSVCKAKYVVKNDTRLICRPNFTQFKAWVQTSAVVVTMSALPVVVYFTWNKIEESVLKVGIVVVLISLEYFFLRLLGFSFLKAYKITKTRALKIIGRKNVENHGGDINNVAIVLAT